MSRTVSVSLWYGLPCDHARFFESSYGPIHCASTACLSLTHEKGSRFCRNCGQELTSVLTRDYTEQWRKFADYWQWGSVDKVYRILRGEWTRGEVGSLRFFDRTVPAADGSLDPEKVSMIGILLGRVGPLGPLEEDLLSVAVSPDLQVHGICAKMDWVRVALDLHGEAMLYLVGDDG